MSENLFYDPPFLLMPWTPTATGILLETAMSRVYERLKSDELYGEVFHENPEMTFSQFIQFFSQPQVVPQVCVDVTNPDWPEEAGLVWLSDFERLHTHTRATGSFVWFKHWQKPQWTNGFARMALRYWFTPAPDGLGVDLLVGMTPKLNRAARLFSVRSGLKYVSQLPNYTSYRGVRCDALIAVLEKADYDAKHGTPVGVEETKRG